MICSGFEHLVSESRSAYMHCGGVTHDKICRGVFVVARPCRYPTVGSGFGSVMVTELALAVESFLRCWPKLRSYTVIGGACGVTDMLDSRQR